MLGYEKMIYDKNFKSDNEEMNLINNFPLAFKVAEDIRKHLKNSATYDFEDIVQTSLLYLCMAFKRFDKEKNNQFSTFATIYCKGGISKFLRKQSSLHLTHGALEKVGQYNKEKKEDLTLTPELFCERHNYKLQEFKYILKSKEALSLDKEYNEGNTLLNIIDGFGNFENELCQKIDFENAFKLLNDEEQEILKLRFCENGYTRKELAEIKSITLGQMRYKEDKIMKKLKESMQII